MLRSDPRIHYKMYKAKKNMVYAALFSFAVLGGLGLSQNAKADTVENNNVTPAVQTTAVTSQSTATPQSSAADVNAVNSTPTAQPVSAQPVVNSQANSASNAGNQIQTTALNVQPVQPAQRFAATHRARLYAQSLTQQKYSANAQDVSGNFELEMDPNSPSTHDLKVPKDEAFSGHVNLNFNVKNEDLKAGNTIYLGRIDFKHSTSPWHNGPGLLQDGVIIRAKGQIIGRLHIQSDMVLNVTNDLQNPGPGVTNFQVALTKGSFLMNYQYPASAYGDVNQDQTDTMQLIDPTGKVLDSAKVTFTSPQIEWHSKDEHYTVTKPFINIMNPRNGGGVVNIGFAGNVTDDEATQLIHSNGDNQLRYSPHYQFAFRIKKPTDNSILVSDNFGKYASAVSYNLWLSNGQGQVARQALQTWASDTTAMQYDMGDNLTLAQMKAQIKPNSFGFSQQADGSILCFINIDYDTVMKPDSNSVIKAARDDSYSIASLPESQRQAAAEATERLRKDGLDLTELNVAFKLADPTVNSKVDLELINPNNGNIIVQSSDKIPPVQLMAHGQAAVKLHVINATNGTELNQSSKLMNEAQNKKNSSQ